MPDLTKDEALAKIKELLKKAPEVIEGYKQALSAVSEDNRSKIGSLIENMELSLANIQAASPLEIQLEVLSKLYDDSYQLVGLLSKEIRASYKPICSTSEYNELEAALFPKHKIQGHDLPFDVVQQIGGKLDPASVRSYGSTSRFYNEFSGRKEAIPKELTHKLLSAVVDCDVVLAENILKKFPEFLTARGDITDYAGRTFKDITAYECAFFYKHSAMLKMMQRCIPEGPKGDKIRADLSEQENRVRAELAPEYNPAKLLEADEPPKIKK